VWIAYSKLYEEQEKACDVFVVERGIRPADYASHILDLACFSMRSVSFQGSFLSKGRKKLLERRILHTLSFKRKKNLSKGGKTMKVRNFILLCTILLIAIALIGSCATRRKAISETDFLETISGTWIGQDAGAKGCFLH
jgi:beta-lactamase regulating signal transducer with metallopeptidase domain